MIICEARTGEGRNGPASSENIQHLLEKIQTVQRVFPGREVSYLLMASPEYLFDGGRLKNEGKRFVSDMLCTLRDELARRRIPVMLLSYRFSSEEFARKGLYIFEMYRRLQRRSGDLRWEDGKARVARQKGLLDLSFGPRREIYQQNPEGHWVPIETPQRP